MVGHDAKPAGRLHDPFRLGDEDDLEGRGLLAPARLVQPGDREDLEGAAEVQDLDVREHDNTDPLAIHPCRSSTNLGKRSLIWPRRTTSARLSSSVGSALTITTRAPASFAMGTTPATGYTESFVPTVSMRSHRAAACWARRRSVCTSA